MLKHLINYNLLMIKPNTVKRSLITLANVLFFALISSGISAQTLPSISYSSPASANTSITLTQNTAMSPLTPYNTGGAVAAFGYSPTAFTLTGATLQLPWGMGIDPSDKIYVVNYTTTNKSTSGTISKYNSSGVYQGTYGTGGTLYNPTGIVFDASGNGYVLDYNRGNNGIGNNNGNAYIEQYNSAGTYQGTIVSGLGSNATGLAIDASNNLYIALGTQVSEYTNGGQLAQSILAPTGGNVVAVGVDGSYNIYMLDNVNNDVVEYSSTGTYIKTILVGLNNPNAFYVDGGGDVYVGNSGDGTVTIYNPNLAIGSNLFTITGFTDPRGIATDSKGYLYITDNSATPKVTQYKPTGGYFISGQLPPGLSFNSTTGVISGTPTSGFNPTTYTITAYNATGSSSTKVTLYCPVNISISYSPSINVYTIGTAIANLLPTTAGIPAPNSFSINPSLTPTGLSFNTNTGAISGTPTTPSAATVYTVTASNGTNTATTTLSIACVVDNYWTGNVDQYWETPGNWNAGHVPINTERASIGVVYNYKAKKASNRDPVVKNANTQAYYVTFGSLTTAENLTVQTGATLTINNVLTVNANATPTFIGQGTGALNFIPAAVLYVNGMLAISNPITTASFVTLQSNATSSASIGESTGSVTGNVNVQRYIPAGYRGYRLLSSPVNTGTTDSWGNKIYSINYLLNSVYTSGTGAGFTVPSKTGNPSMYLFRENMKPQYTTFLNSCYRGISDINASPNYTLNIDGALNSNGGPVNIPIGNGYLFYFRGGITSTSATVAYTAGSIPGDATLAATGTLNQGSITFRHWYTPGTAGLMYSTISGDPTIEGFNVIGNPYACTIDLGTYATGGISMTNISKFVYELDPVSKNYGVFALDGSVPSKNNASRYIASGQGFVVMAAGTSPSSLTFNESCKVENMQNTGANLLLSKAPVANIVPRYLRLQMALDSNNMEETIFSFNDNAKTSYVFDEDALYRVGSGSVNIASFSSDNRMVAVNTMPLDTKGVSVNIKINAAASGTYSLKMNSIQGIPQLYDIWLMDAYKKDSVDLRHNKTYLFDIIKTDTGSFGAHRFKLIMRQNPAFAYHLLNFTASKATGRQVQLNWVTENEANYTNFTVERSTDGGASYAVVGGVPSTGASQYGLLDKNPGENNLYRLKQEDINNQITYSHIIPIGFTNQGDNLAGNINIYPNPAGSVINMAVSTAVNDKAAIYNFTITNNYGFIVKQGTSPQANWQANISGLLPGNYIIQVVNTKDKSFIGKSKLVKL
jgi:sugar lactone lactonase YvrE